MKLRKLHIEDYKMFKDFDISFVDENDEALPIVVLAGVNGSGKTTLLEFIGNREFVTIFSNDDKREKLFANEKDSYQLFFNNQIREFNLDSHFTMGEVKKFIDNTIYISANEALENIKVLIPKYLHTMVWDEDILASEAFQRFRDYMENLLGVLNIGIEFVSRDGKGELYFRNKESTETFLIEELSTGEKTLLSKALYLYVKDYKDKVILIDEPELSLHPSWQNQVLKIYENFALKNNCQIIIATHSPHIIGSAKPEYIRLLKKEKDRVVVIENIDRSYGLEFDKILTDIMGVENLRTPAVAKDVRRLWDLLADEDYESEEYQLLYSKLEKDLGDLDKDMVLARLEVAKIKSRNAKSK